MHRVAYRITVPKADDEPDEGGSLSYPSPSKEGVLPVQADEGHKRHYCLLISCFLLGAPLAFKVFGACMIQCFHNPKIL